MNITKLFQSKKVRFVFCGFGGTILLPGLLFLIANWLFPLPVEKLHQPPATLILDREGEWLRAFTAPDEAWRIPEPSLEQVSPKLRTAVLTYEDRWFYQHFGINPVSIVQAAIDNVKAGQVVRGGSTITMQIARMMEPKDRTVPNKLIEIFRALQLEFAYSKDALLSLYFNMAPYGGNIVGSAAAARVYFDKPQDRLSLGEAALLAAIPNAPTYLRPDLYPENARKAREKVLRRMFAYGKITQQALEEALKEPIPNQRYAMPFKAPHAALLLKQMYPDKARVHSTIDSEIQALAERILQLHLAPLRPTGITNGAVVVMDTESREVLAMVGSYAFFDDASEGQVNGAIAPRSPGSALKPFIYALALDRGLITPERLLHDVPIDYAGYNPLNYDGKYHGYVTARDALAQSLNVPAVGLAAQLGSDGLYTFLKKAGISTLPEPQEHYGLSLALGGCEVTLLELTTLYAGLANLGDFAPYQLTRQPPAASRQLPAGARHASPLQPEAGSWKLSFTPKSEIRNPKSEGLLSKEACYILTEMLTEVRRPDLPTCFESTVNLPKVAWKTGTSYGHRDAWSVGYTPDYTIGVWVGNFNGQGVSSLVGAEVAGPILFALFNALTTHSNNHWFKRPYQALTRKVCALSGMPVSAHCPSAKVDDYIPNVSSSEPCTFHKTEAVDDGTGFALCSYCRVGRTYRKVVFEEWPAEIATWLNRNGFAVQKIPAHNPQCTGVVAGREPIIRSPAETTEYYLRTGIPPEHQKILLEASVSNRTREIFWFVNGELLFKGSPTEKVFFTPVAGRHTLTCIDDEGRSASRLLVIK